MFESLLRSSSVMEEVVMVSNAPRPQVAECVSFPNKSCPHLVNASVCVWSGFLKYLAAMLESGWPLTQSFKISASLVPSGSFPPSTFLRGIQSSGTRSKTDRKSVVQGKNVGCRTHTGIYVSI